ncbi:MAG: nucleotidyltransferase domain-containing protein, partial [Thermosphaera sp.]
AEERIKSFIEKIKDAFDPELILLFGSRTRGDALRSSDYDIIVISRTFKKMDFQERIIKVYELITETP